MAALPLAEGPAMFFGSTIMSFALPYGAFIVIATVVFFLLRARHSGPPLKYLRNSSSVASVTTREPGPAPAPSVAAGDAKPKGKPAEAGKTEKTGTAESKEGGE